MNLVLLGAPGAGKGTQAEILKEKLAIPTISTGNILREAVKNETKLGLEAKGYMDSGKLVPDALVISIIKERLAKDDCKNGFILDGFPRTIPQAEALEESGVVIDRAVEIAVSDEAILARLSGRRVCIKCGAPYHIVSCPPPADNICPKCGGEIITRKDDLPETIKSRLEVYHSQTEPIKGFYEERGKLSVVPGEGGIENTSRAILEALGV